MSDATADELVELLCRSRRCLQSPLPRAMLERCRLSRHSWRGGDHVSWFRHQYRGSGCLVGGRLGLAFQQQESAPDKPSPVPVAPVPNADLPDLKADGMVHFFSDAQPWDEPDALLLPVPPNPKWVLGGGSDGPSC